VCFTTRINELVCLFNVFQQFFDLGCFEFMILDAILDGLDVLLSWFIIRGQKIIKGQDRCTSKDSSGSLSHRDVPQVLHLRDIEAMILDD
jgi:hypothetical protein